jgi:hypothetical protein
MDKNEYLKLAKSKLHNRNSKKLLINQINNFYKVVDECKKRKHKYKVWDLVKLKKWTLLHWTWKNIEWLESIAKHWLITWQFKWWREWKYLYTVGVWNLRNDILLKDYINFYSWGTIKYFFWWKNGKAGFSKQKIISFNEMKGLLGWLKKEWVNTWYMEQTKEARFMPGLAQDFVQIWIIMDGNSKYGKLLKEWDILDLRISDKDVKEFVHPEVYESFFVPNRKNKDLFFTDRESAILFWIPPVLIEWILVWRKYEKDNKMLKRIKELLPKAYISNLDGMVIME